eukprot:953185_1
MKYAYPMTLRMMIAKKSGAISHACYDDGKLDPWQSGDSNAMCNDVECGPDKVARFGVKDGCSCYSSGAMSGLTIDGISGISCGYTPNEPVCMEGTHKECTWEVPVPCTGTTSEPDTTTVTEPETTTVTSPDTT